MVGMKFGRLTVLQEVRDDRRFSVEAKCECGVTAKFSAYRLKTGETKSCGCLRREITRARALLPSNQAKSYAARYAWHGGVSPRFYQRPEFKTWQRMISRCEGKSIRNYGARGISVCARWRRDFPAFLADMGPRPSAKHSIDRINSDGNYEPGNCRWATTIEQARNKRNTLKVSIGKVVMTLKEAAEMAGVKYHDAWWALRRQGRDIYDALEMCR